jgi:hypothetical protein
MVKKNTEVGNLNQEDGMILVKTKSIESTLGKAKGGCLAAVSEVCCHEENPDTTPYPS